MNPGTSRSRKLGVGFAAGVTIVIAVALFANTGNGEKHSTAFARPTASAQSDRGNITSVVADFARAIEAGDADGLYRVQSEAYQQGCSRTEFAAVVSSMKRQKIGGIKAIQIQGGLAAATVTQRLPDGSEASQLLPLQREKDGSWKLAAPATVRCLP